LIRRIQITDATIVLPASLRLFYAVRQSTGFPRSIPCLPPLLFASAAREKLPAQRIPAGLLSPCTST